MKEKEEGSERKKKRKEGYKKAESTVQYNPKVEARVSITRLPEIIKYIYNLTNSSCIPVPLSLEN